MTTRSHHKDFIAGGLVLAGALALAGCASMGGKSTSTLPPADAYAQLYDSKGADRGRADIYRDTTGLRVELVARGFGAGTYGMHVHSVCKSTPHDFANARPHWTPLGAQYSPENPMRATQVDLPKATVETYPTGNNPHPPPRKTSR